MKTTHKTIACLACFLMVTVSNAQTPPFDIPPSEVNQPPTPDQVLSGIGNITLEPTPEGGGGDAGESCPVVIERTGADMQLTKPSVDQTVAKVVVYDGCPGFYFSISPDEYSPPTQSVGGKFEGSKYGLVTDPDVILTQNNSNGNVSILIVYQIFYDDKNRIAFEQWDYDASLNILSLNYPTSLPSGVPNIITGGANEQINPNIAGNNDNEIAIVYINENISQTSMATQLSTFSIMPSSTDFNASKEQLFNGCIGSNFKTPDVSISDNTTSNNSVVSYVAVEGNNLNNHDNLWLFQGEYTHIISQAGTISCDPNNFKETQLDNNCKNPRIASPKESYISHEKECAITAEKIFGSPLSDYGIKVYHNHQTPPFFSDRFLNYNAGYPSNIIPASPNEFPAIAYASEGYVSVAWTYNGGGAFKEDLISVNYDLFSGIRMPSSYDYYMRVNQTLPDDQYAVSLAGGSFVSSGNHPIFYAYTDGSDVFGKTSNTFTQAYIRKKVSLNEPSETEVSIYPNPTNDLINIDFNSIDIKSAVNVRIIGIDGKLVYKKTALKNEFNKPLNVSSFGKGIYLIEYSYDDVMKREKIVIQ